jgi:general stress protein CsbA
MPADNSTAVSEEHPPQKSLLKQLFGIYEIILIALILLSIIGIGITDFSPADSHRYWFAMVPVFAGACLILEWSRARGKGQKWTTIIRTQLLLWLGLLLAVRLAYLLLHTGRLDNENIGLIILLLLALTTFFAGIHLGWRLFIVGIFLGVALIGATYLEEFVWIFLIIAIGVVAIFLLWKYYAGTRMAKKQDIAADG